MLNRVTRSECSQTQAYQWKLNVGARNNALTLEPCEALLGAISCIKNVLLFDRRIMDIHRKVDSRYVTSARCLFVGVTWLLLGQNFMRFHQDRKMQSKSVVTLHCCIEHSEDVPAKRRKSCGKLYDELHGDQYW